MYSFACRSCSKLGRRLEQDCQEVSNWGQKSRRLEQKCQEVSNRGQEAGAGLPEDKYRIRRPQGWNRIARR